jgi:hypothetical protein
MSNRAIVFAAIAAITLSARADEKERLRAVPFVFVGSASECGVAGSNIVTAAWLRGMGLPDNGQPNTTSAGRDPHSGLLLNKNGATADCSSAGATIRGVKGMKVTATFALGFDYRNGTHCGAGAPRFNVTTQAGTFHFVGGCANSAKVGAVQDPEQWTTVSFLTSNPAQAFPPIPADSTIESITLIYDEGTDATSVPDDPNGVGLSVVDNIFINGQFIRSGKGIAEPRGDSDDDD